MATARARLLAACGVVALLGSVVACTPAVGDASVPAASRSVVVVDAPGDVAVAQASADDLPDSPPGGVDLHRVALSDVGDRLRVEFEGVPDVAAVGEPAVGGRDGIDRDLLYVLRVWGTGPQERFTFYAIAADAHRQSGSRSRQVVYLCRVVQPLEVCALEQAERVDAPGVVATATTFTFEVPWESVGTARTTGFRWVATAQLVQVEGERWDLWFDDVPDRPHPVATMEGATIVRGPAHGPSIDPPTQAGHFPPVADSTR